MLHVEPDGSFSVTAMVWQPGQVTPVHDHVTWCVFGVVQGIEYEELYAVSADGSYLTELGRSQNSCGEVSGFAPPGDIHRVANIGSGVAISLHVYGADITRLGSSIRRTYDLPACSTAAGQQLAEPRQRSGRASSSSKTPARISARPPVGVKPSRR